MNDDAAAAQTARIARSLLRSGGTAAAAESVTGGNVTSHLSAGESASDWFHGGVIAYSEEVKFSVLNVDRGPVITDRCAEQMAVGVAKLLKTDYAVATTGAGGPGEQEGKPAGTVFIAVATPDGSRVVEYHFGGDPSEVVRQATAQALTNLAEAVPDS